ncbi:hypothetical protein BYT27DRAFT_7220810 [Phlegmacium glaucopus]|nr:hypothetical protein BYT27DRAFT_7220810 [Phlegmacium glaucopus]
MHLILKKLVQYWVHNEGNKVAAHSKKPAKSIAKFQDGAVIGLISMHDTFPDISLCCQWTLWCWKQVLKDADEWIEILDRMITLDPDTMSGFAQNKIISEILYLAWFEDKPSIDFCLREWSTGVFLQATFFEKDKIFSQALRNAGVVDEDATIISGLVGEAKDRVQTELDG